jgi:predicted small metal-binding protein
MKGDGTVMYTDCAQGHSTVRVTGSTEDEFVRNVQDHLRKVHSGMALPPREDILKMAKQD